MELVVEGLVWLCQAFCYFVVSAVVGSCQAMAGLLSDATTPRAVAYQRWAKVLILLSLAAFAIGWILLYTAVPAVLEYLIIIVSLLGMIIAGLLGNVVEQEAKRNR